MLLEIFFSLFTLIILEAILGIDNLVFISILSSRLPAHQQKKARRIGLTMAWAMRLLLLLGVVWIIAFTKPLFYIFDRGFSGRDLFLLGGGAFLLAKATREIHTEIETAGNSEKNSKYSNFFFIIIQITLFDIVFSLDSILAAIGLTHTYWIMATAITIAVLLMILASEPLSRFINRYPTVKMLALSFLLLIGMVLVADGLHFDIPRGYLYFAVCFSLLVEFLNNLIARKKKAL